MVIIFKTPIFENGLGFVKTRKIGRKIRTHDHQAFNDPSCQEQDERDCRRFEPAIAKLLMTRKPLTPRATWFIDKLSEDENKWSNYENYSSKSIRARMSTIIGDICNPCNDLFMHRLQTFIVRIIIDECLLKSLNELKLELEGSGHEFGLHYIKLDSKTLYTVTNSPDTWA